LYQAGRAGAVRVARGEDLTTEAAEMKLLSVILGDSLWAPQQEAWAELPVRRKRK
jgi:hypothetical protein